MIDWADCPQGYAYRRSPLRGACYRHPPPVSSVRFASDFDAERSAREPSRMPRSSLASRIRSFQTQPPSEVAAGNERVRPQRSQEPLTCRSTWTASSRASARRRKKSSSTTSKVGPLPQGPPDHHALRLGRPRRQGGRYLASGLRSLQRRLPAHIAAARVLRDDGVGNCHRGHAADAVRRRRRDCDKSRRVRAGGGRASVTKTAAASKCRFQLSLFAYESSICASTASPPSSPASSWRERVLHLQLPQVVADRELPHA